MSNLTPTESERLRVWSAGVMGWHQSSYGHHWRDSCRPVMLIGSWHPDTDLDQAVMVAEKIGEWKIGNHWGKPGQYRATLYVPTNKLYCDVHYANGNTPAEALLIACAKSAGEKWRDEGGST